MSGHLAAFIGIRTKDWDWLYRDYLLAMFSQKRHLAIKAYKEFEAGQEPEEIKEFYTKKNVPSILGCADFKEWIKEKFHYLRSNTEIPESRSLSLNSDTIKELVRKDFGLEKETLMHSKRGTENLPRDVAIYLQRKYCRQTLVELGKDFNLANYSSVSSAFERVKLRLSKDRRLREQVARIERGLSKSQENT
ncbi:MAG: hypothetical protein KKD63_14465 [Proteobacteria bacterium]|nr:hypothetical protein [Desulfobulbaceae bacterium]MBU4154072.1 hypothetical protein [Pseudomonadota bacterium]